MPEQQLDNTIDLNSKLSLQRAFEVFQRQSDALEKAHRELQEKLTRTQLDLAEKNKQLARKIIETESIKERLSSVLSSITDAVLLVNNEGGVELANVAAKQLFPAEVEGQGSLTEREELKVYLLKGERVTDINLQMVINKDRRNFLLSIVPMRDIEEERGKLVLSLKDITEYKRLQERVSREDRLSALGKVAASVAHEI